MQKSTLNPETTIGENSFFEGKFVVNGTLKIDGKFEGDSLEVEQLIIGPRGRVKTDIYASSVVVEGIVIGNIIASSRVFLMPDSKILGDITAPELIIQNGVVLKGNCRISNNNDIPAEELLEKLYQEDL